MRLLSVIFSRSYPVAVVIPLDAHGGFVRHYRLERRGSEDAVNASRSELS